MKTSIQGFRGSFHHQVAKELKIDKELLLRADFDSVFLDVISNRADFGIVAIENSIAGAILENYDRLRNSGLKVLGEYYLRIKMNLIAYPGQKITDITEVHSHPMALKQTQDFLQDYPNIKQVEHADTALAVEEIMQDKLKGRAGIAGETAAAEFKAEILAAEIETDPQNYTRFLIIGRHDNAKLPQLTYTTNSTNKASVYLETNHESGALLKVLQIFEDLKLNMTMLVSRPVIGEAFNYGFYIDFESEGLDVGLLTKKLDKVTEKLQIFGVYSGHVR